jgi:transposase
MKCDKYMGMDVHQAMTVVAVLDADGRVILETMVLTEAAAIIRLVQSLSGPLRVTFEESGVYQPKQRQRWLELLTEGGIRQRLAWLYEQLDQLKPLRREAKQAMLAESRRHRAVSLLRTIPQMGPIRCAFIVATVDTPHRFRTRRQFWSYVGLAVVTHMSSEYEMTAGRVVRRRKPVATRGLNHNCNRRLRGVHFSGSRWKFARAV